MNIQDVLLDKPELQQQLEEIQAIAGKSCELPKLLDDMLPLQREVVHKLVSLGYNVTITYGKDDVQVTASISYCPEEAHLVEIDI